MASTYESEQNIDLKDFEGSRWARLNPKTGPDGLVPAVIQDHVTGKVLMLAYLNAAAWEQSVDSGVVTFFSRSKQRLWIKGENSGNFLRLHAAALDCDADAFLLKAAPSGPICHTGADTCWAETNEDKGAFSFLNRLEALIRQRAGEDIQHSYTAALFAKGIPKIAQKVGEEAVETVIEALGEDRAKLLEEAADLVFHLMVLLAAKGTDLAEVEAVLRKRHNK
jgi:phosphoribosyl-AMP cyclohydrolase / phosphoribosyl-ATP pyrophosphohydrolase